MMSFVYVVEAQMGLIKIGCSERPAVRLAAIRTHSPVLARLVAFWPGAIADEHALHERFRAQRSHSEWFRIDGPVLEFLTSVRGQGIGRVEDWSEITFEGSESRRDRGRLLKQSAHRAHWANPAFRLERLIDLRVGRALSREFGGTGVIKPEDRPRADEIRRAISAEVTEREAARNRGVASEASAA